MTESRAPSQDVTSNGRPPLNVISASLSVRRISPSVVSVQPADRPFPSTRPYRPLRSRKNQAAHVPLSRADDELQVCSGRDSLRYGARHSFTGIDDELQYSEVGGMQIWDHKVAVLTIT